MKLQKEINRVCLFLLLPSLVGVLLFYIFPFIMSAYYALIDNMVDKNFVGLENFTAILQNRLFLRAAKNTAVFIGISVPLSMLSSLLFAMGLKNMKRGRTFASLGLLFPIIVPSGTIVYFWKIIFDSNGLINKLLADFGFETKDFSRGWLSMAVIIIAFLWKNVGYNVVLFWSGLNWIPQIYYEVYGLEGGNKWQQFKAITWVYLSPTTFVVLLMSIANSFKVYKEVYLLYGAYPASDIYMLQHYMNNQFQSLNMQKLCSAAYIMFLVISMVLLVLFYAQKKISDSYQ